VFALFCAVLTQDVGYYTESADVYSAGLVMWYIATGRRPQTPDLENVKAGAVVRPDVDQAKWPELAEIMKKCWEHDPKKRISASAAIMLLKALPDAAELLHIDPTPVGCCTIS
jgi:serine/threonine protein kinase